MAVTVGATQTLTWPDAPTEGTITLTVTRPDGVLEAPAVTTTGDKVTARYPTVHPGRHLLAWTSEDERYADILDVWPEDPRYLISIDDALAAIRSKLTAAKDAARDDIGLYVAAATFVIENITGPIIRTEKTRTARYNGRSIVLPEPGQVMAVQAADGPVLDPAAYTVDDEAGVVWVAAPAGVQLTVTYAVGSTTIPANARLAAREQVRFLWQVGHQASRVGSQGPDLTPFTSEGFAVPRRVIELLQGMPRIAGFA